MLMSLQKMHKRVHDLVTKSLNLILLQSEVHSQVVSVLLGSNGSSNPFSNFRFTGKMRPVYPLSPTRLVPEHIKRPDYAETGRLMRFGRGV